MIGRLISIVFSLILGAALVAVFFFNRQEVPLVLIQAMPPQPEFAIKLPFYLYIFLFLIVGIMIGGFASWMRQGKWRRIARQRTQEAMRWKAEAERLARERDANVIERKNERKHLALTG